MDPIWNYLVDGTLPSDPKEASKLRARSARFTVHQETLYKRGFSTPILKCIGKEDGNYILREVHEGIYGNHIRARTLVGKTLRQGVIPNFNLRMKPLFCLLVGSPAVQFLELNSSGGS